MKSIEFVRDHKAAISDVLAQFHVRNLRYVPEATEPVDVVLLVQPDRGVSYFDLFKLELALEAELRAKVAVLTEGGLEGTDRNRILGMAEKV
ncbi:hypothetical protein [Paraburkholderia acidiphila]|uniref:Uncharacterized protein n=1 Tax=Paraburkholderia acidiphila TaxID=2571747 RepID=A0A7Z2G3V0_9BURK|nr:hypothetical protein [Paraburkholderia acidiphila]QGZ54289.1 hypothetical protein FAZ97_04805 [Paraburkholderia acidiphila]